MRNGDVVPPVYIARLASDVRAELETKRNECRGEAVVTAYYQYLVDGEWRDSEGSHRSLCRSCARELMPTVPGAFIPRGRATPIVTGSRLVLLLMAPEREHG